MIIKNTRSFPTALTFGKTSPSERFLTLIIKGTFALAGNGEPARTLPDQRPILQGDEPYSPDRSGGLVRLESDLAPFKPRADIVLVGQAYTQRDKATVALDVHLRVGRTQEVLRVVGERAWVFAPGSPFPKQVGPMEFHHMPLTFDRAFGGTDEHAKVQSPVNHFGKGLIAAKTVESIHGTALPNIEDPAHMIQHWDTRPTPVGCGFYPKSCQPRARYLGTYDARWKAERAPDLPEDFRFDFFNAAHPHLQVEGYLAGNESVTLTHVVEGGKRLDFYLPCLRPRITVDRKIDGGVAEAYPTRAHTTAHELKANLDTLVFVPDEGIFYLVWRATTKVRGDDASEFTELRIEWESIPPATEPDGQERRGTGQ